jgi:autotransporter-associated beta strand protein
MIVLRGLISPYSDRPTASRRVPRRQARYRAHRAARDFGVEFLEDRRLLAFDPTAIQQELLESVNRMRLNPQGELAVLFSSINPLVARDADAQRNIVWWSDPTSASIQADWGSLVPAHPLAWSEPLTVSATQYSITMMNADVQSHNLGGTNAGSRAVAAGYSSIYVAENIAAHSYSAFNAHSQLAIDAGVSSRGHRFNIMDINFSTRLPMGMREIGIGAVPNTRAAVNSSLTQPLIVTQNFGRRTDQGNPFLLGVAYADRNGDGRYNAGEGLGGITIVVSGSLGTFTTTTMTAGGYQLQVPAGAYQITVSGANYSGPSSATVQIGADNVKRDFIAPPSNIAVPTAPTGVLATASNAQVGLTWTAPSSNGGAAITEYVIQYSSNSGSSWTEFPRAASTLTSAAVTGLTNGTNYIFRVAARNSVGIGSWSPNSSTVTPTAEAAVPTAPTGVLVTASNAQVGLTWTAPSSNGGAAITEYVIQYSSNSGGSWTEFPRAASTLTSAVVTGLTNGTAYVFRVAAVNNVGVSAFSANSAAVVPFVAVGLAAVRELRVMPGTISGELLAAWEITAAGGAASITDFLVQASPDNGLSWQSVDDGVSTQPYASLTGLNPSQSFVIRVAAVTPEGAGPWSAYSAVVSPSGANSETFVEFVHIGDPGNATDPATGGLYGGVDYEYRIGRFEITIGQYVKFLNSVAADDPNGLYKTYYYGGPGTIYIARSGVRGSYSYTALEPFGDVRIPQVGAENRPISRLGWFEAARFANWLHNGKPAGQQDATTTEAGVYTLSNGTITGASITNRVVTYYLSAPSTLAVGDQLTVSGFDGSSHDVFNWLNGFSVVTAVTPQTVTVSKTLGGRLVPDIVQFGEARFAGASTTRAAGARFFLPNENEWYKAAYYDPTLMSGGGGYWKFATRSNEVPGNVVGPAPNQANYRAGSDLRYSVTQSADFTTAQDYLVNVGAYSGSGSYYETYDQTGSVGEALEGWFVSRGSSFESSGGITPFIGASISSFSRGSGFFYSGGIRLASRFDPEPFVHSQLFLSPAFLEAAAVGEEVNLSWQPPAPNAGFGLVGYVVQQSVDGGETWEVVATTAPSVTTQSISKGQAGQQQLFRVAATSVSGVGAFTGPVSAASLTGPSAPTNLVGTPGNRQVSLTWTAPSSNGGAAISDYVVQYSSNSGVTWETFNRAFSTATFTTVTGLTNGTAYVFRVAAVNSAGTGTYSGNSESVTPLADAPTNRQPTAIMLEDSIQTLPEGTSTLSRTRVATLALTDDGVGTNTFTLLGADAVFFEVVGDGLYLKAGVSLDYGTKPRYDVAVRVSDATAIDWLADTTLTGFYDATTGAFRLENTTDEALAFQSVTIVSPMQSLSGVQATLPAAAFSTLNSEFGLYGVHSEIFFANFGSPVLTLASGARWDLGAVAVPGMTSTDLMANFATEMDADPSGESAAGRFLYSVVGQPVVRGALVHRVEASFVLEITSAPEHSGREFVEVPVGQEVIDTNPRSGERQLVMRGGGRTVLNAANTHSGGTRIEAGEVVIRHASALGSGSLEVLPGARVTLDVDFSRANVSNLVVHEGAVIDVGRGGLVLPAGSMSSAEVRALLVSGRNGGAWNGSGISTSDAPVGSRRGVGYRVMTNNSIVVGWAAFGDTNLDGRVNSTDVNMILQANRFGTTATDGGWWQGDFNYDGRVNTSDINMLISTGLLNAPSYHAAAGGTSQQAFASSGAMLAAAFGPITSELEPEVEPEPDSLQQPEAGVAKLVPEPEPEASPVMVSTVIAASGEDSEAVAVRVAYASIEQDRTAAVDPVVVPVVSDSVEPAVEAIHAPIPADAVRIESDDAEMQAVVAGEVVADTSTTDVPETVFAEPVVVVTIPGPESEPVPASGSAMLVAETAAGARWQHDDSVGEGATVSEPSPPRRVALAPRDDLALISGAAVSRPESLAPSLPVAAASRPVPRFAPQPVRQITRPISARVAKDTGEARLIAWARWATLGSVGNRVGEPAKSGLPVDRHQILSAFRRFQG